MADINGDISVHGTCAKAEKSISVYDCLKQCSSSDCGSASFSKSQSLCRIRPTSPWHLSFTGNVTENNDWKTYVRVTGVLPEWKPFAKFSTSSGTFEGSGSYELWNSACSGNNDSCVSDDLGVRCEKHYVHCAKDWLLGINSGNKVKISLYDNGNEVAWVTFDKQPGSDDNWFQPSRIVDSHPWDTELLKSSSEMSLEPQAGNNKVRFYILESIPTLTLKTNSGHAYWMKIIDTQSTECEYGRGVNYPYILYSKGTSATLLSKSAVVRIVKWNPGHYSLPWSEAQTFCQNNLHVPIATYGEVNNARIYQPYDCCARGWMANQINSYPIIVGRGGCGGPGMAGTSSSGSYDVYCKPDQSLVGVADTMVISIKV